LEAATALASAERWDFDVTVIRIDTQIYRFLTAVPKGNADLLKTANVLRSTFRKMSPTETAALKPLRIRVVTVGSGDTMSTLAAKMMGTDRKLELFRLLNAIPVGGILKTGDRVKIVSE